MTSRSRWGLLGSVGGGAVLVAMLFPWWDETSALSLQTHWPKVTLVGGVLMLSASIAATLNRPWAIQAVIASTALVGISLVAFYFRVVQTEFFADLAFTHNVEIGFFVALLGFGWGGVSATALVLEAPARTWIGPALCLIAVGGLVLSLSATNADAERTKGLPIPPPVDRFRRP